MITIVTWLWGKKYGVDYVMKLRQGLRRNLRMPFRFILMTERERFLPHLDGIEKHAIQDPALLKIPGCFVRLRMFDPAWQKARNINGRVVNLDLDVVVTGALDSILTRDESFVVLQGANATNPCPYNCSVYMFQAGQHADLWHDFSIDRLPEIPRFEFPDDQGWIWKKIPHAAAWFVGTSGIYAFQKPGWPRGSKELPANARLVAFPGKRDPSQFMALRWVRENWG